MLSNKWTFSLTSLLLILAFSFVVSPVMAQFDVTLGVDPTGDVSFADNFQAARVAAGASAPNPQPVTGLNMSARGIKTTIRITTGAVVAGLKPADFTIVAYNKFGGVAPTIAPAVADSDGNINPNPVSDMGSIVAISNLRNAGNIPDGKNFEADLWLDPAYDADASPAAVVTNDNIVVTKVILYVAAGKVEVADPSVNLGADDKKKRKNKASNSLTVEYVGAEPTTALVGTAGSETSALRANAFNFGGKAHTAGAPVVYSMQRPGNVVIPSVAYGTDATFSVVVTLSEEPRKDTFTKDIFSISEADITAVTALTPIDETTGTNGLVSTGRDGMIYKYLLTITPKYANTNDIVLKINAFEDQEKPIPKRFLPPSPDISRVEGITKLTVKVSKAKPGADLTDGIEVVLNSADNAIIVPKDGYLLVAESKGGSAVVVPATADDKTPDTTKDGPAQQKYKIIEREGLPNLQARLINGVVMDVVAPKGLMVTEVMWGEDSSLEDPSDSQWIELKNTSGEQLTLDKGKKDYKLLFYRHGETVPTQAAPIVDRIGTMTDGTGAGYWSPAGTGQGGRTGEGEKAADFAATIETTSIISMYRVADATDGTLKASWMQSSPPNVNFDPNKSGVRVGTPGAAHIITAAQQKVLDDAAAAKKKSDDAAAAKAADTSVVMPKVGQIYISEVMFAGGGTLPQWIEISNGSRSEEVNLSGWTITVDNAAADADVSVGATATFTIPDGTKIDPSGQHDTPSTILVVTERGRNSLTGPQASGQVLNLAEANEVELILAGVVTGKYTLLSDTAFLITLAPPEPEATKAPAGETKTAKATRQAAEKKAALERKAATDMAGNLGADGAAAWALPMNEEGGRSSIIRRHVQVARGPAAPEDGMMSENWSLASETSFAQVTHIRAQSYYGAANDVGTPGFRAGGALPVELSHFRPARDKDTGAVVITWSTQSELNNAGFFIKRSQQRDGDFQVINATMVPGAGTTSEKQFYTYADTTAQPTVVYYYQIEDVSLDGNRQTLTRGIRLKGHVGAAGKATTTWADLKTHE